MKLFTRRLALGAVCATLLGFSLVGQTALAQEATKPTVMTHDATGRDNCLMCHSGTMPNVKGVPEDHAGRENNTCQWCHAADAAVQTKDTPNIKHDLTGRDNCLMCHSGTMPNVKAVPADHTGRENPQCGWCHTPQTPG